MDAEKLILRLARGSVAPLLAFVADSRKEERTTTSRPQFTVVDEAWGPSRLWARPR